MVQAADKAGYVAHITTISGETPHKSSKSLFKSNGPASLGMALLVRKARRADVQVVPTDVTRRAADLLLKSGKGPTPTSLLETIARTQFAIVGTRSRANAKLKPALLVNVYGDAQKSPLMAASITALIREMAKPHDLVIIAGDLNVRLGFAEGLFPNTVDATPDAERVVRPWLELLGDSDGGLDMRCKNPADYTFRGLQGSSTPDYVWVSAGLDDNFDTACVRDLPGGITMPNDHLPLETCWTWRSKTKPTRAKADAEKPTPSTKRGTQRLWICPPGEGSKSADSFLTEIEAIWTDIAPSIKILADASPDGNDAWSRRTDKEEALAAAVKAIIEAPGKAAKAADIDCKVSRPTSGHACCWRAPRRQRPSHALPLWNDLLAAAHHDVRKAAINQARAGKRPSVTDRPTAAHAWDAVNATLRDDIREARRCWRAAKRAHTRAVHKRNRERFKAATDNRANLKGAFGIIGDEANNAKDTMGTQTKVGIDLGALRGANGNRRAGKALLLEHFTNLFAPADEDEAAMKPHRREHKDYVASVLADVDIASEECDPELDDPFTVEEVLSALGKTPPSGAPGPDGVLGWFYKLVRPKTKEKKNPPAGGTPPPPPPPTTAEILTDLFNAFLVRGSTPPLLKQRVIKLIAKPHGKTIPSELSTYRPVTLQQVLCKVLTRTILSRAMRHLISTRRMPSHSYAFLPRRGVRDATFVLLQSLHHVQETGNVAVAAFLDVVKAFDTVDHDSLLVALRESAGITGKLYRLIGSLLKNAPTALEVAPGQRTNAFNPTRAVPQGDPLSPLLWVIYLADMPECTLGDVTDTEWADILENHPELADKGRPFFVLGLRVGDHVIYMIVFADDVTVLASSTASAQVVIDRVQLHLEQRRSTLCPAKSVWMLVQPPPHDGNRVVNAPIESSNDPDHPSAEWQLRLSGKLMKRVAQHRQLGHTLTEFLDPVPHINSAVRAGHFASLRARRAIRVVRARPHEAAIFAYNPNVDPALNWGAENFSMSALLKTKSALLCAGRMKVWKHFHCSLMGLPWATTNPGLLALEVGHDPNTRWAGAKLRLLTSYVESLTESKTTAAQHTPDLMAVLRVRLAAFRSIGTNNAFPDHAPATARERRGMRKESYLTWFKDVCDTLDNLQANADPDNPGTAASGAARPPKPLHLLRQPTLDCLLDREQGEPGNDTLCITDAKAYGWTRTTTKKDPGGAENQEAHLYWMGAKDCARAWTHRLFAAHGTTTARNAMLQNKSERPLVTLEPVFNIHGKEAAQRALMANPEKGATGPLSNPPKPGHGPDASDAPDKWRRPLFQAATFNDPGLDYKATARLRAGKIRVPALTLHNVARDKRYCKACAPARSAAGLPLLPGTIRHLLLHCEQVDIARKRASRDLELDQFLDGAPGAWTMHLTDDDRHEALLGHLDLDRLRIPLQQKEAPRGPDIGETKSRWNPQREPLLILLRIINRSNASLLRAYRPFEGKHAPRPDSDTDSSDDPLLRSFEQDAN
jgi:hypothetical protein